MKKLFLALLLICALFVPITWHTASSSAGSSYTTLRPIDTGTFNEYRYKITEQFFTLRDKWEIDGELHKKTLENIGILANTGYKYLPDNLQNKNLLKKLLTDLQRGVKFPNNDANYTEIITSISEYLDNANIEAIKWSVQANPSQWNAPLNVTLRGAVTDPTGTQIPKYNYTWWIDDGGKRIVIGRGLSLNYTFKEEGNFSVFLDVTSDHRNSEGNVDVLPFSSRADIQVNEKIASLIIKVNGDKLGNAETLKYNPSEARYGLLFDATSSTPTGWAKFTRTEWDFGNGVKREYNGVPRVERVVYGREGEYSVSLKLRTNESKVVERRFTVSINDPIATISASQDDGYIGDKFTFSAKSSGSDKNLSYAWEVIDIDADDIVARKSEKLFTHTFTDKGKYNVRLKVTQVSGEVDVDTQILSINSRAPVAEFTSKIPLSHKPNRVFFDASRSFDPDFSDDGKLIYTWFIDGEKVNLEDANSNGSVGYYVFDSVGSHDVHLEVRDPDNIVSLKKSKVQIDSILSVETFAFPRVIQRESFIRFVAESPEAEIFEWDFGDGTQKGGNKETINHTFNKSGAFDVKLKVRDADNNQNTFTKTVYVWESDKPLAILDVTSETELLTYDSNACSGKGGYNASRVSPLRFNAGESINIDGKNAGLEYTWKIGNSKFSTNTTVNHKFDEIGCFPVKLTVKSKKNGRTSSRTVYMNVRNKLPVLSSLDVTIQNEESDPLVVTVDALGAKDPDGIIQSYLWYYYTDTDGEPQDFRSSTKPSTTFVLPKITGEYFFVVILKDNNEARITSEDATGGAKFFTTVTGDNINTPLVDMSVSDSSVAIGDEVTFSTQVKDILGQDISKKSRFSWDFDGDGFYDMEGIDKNISYRYKKSGTFYAKVKVKHKGISTTKNVTVNVSNKIVPDFEYISIGNKYIFFDTSNGELDSRNWDLGDGTKTSGKTFVHEYSDKKASHNVKLQVSEGTRTKDVEKKVVKNVKNVLSSRGEGLNLFSVPKIDAEGKVVLENEHDKFYVYMGESKGDIRSYAIDYDLELDSDLNGGKDDDEDNKGTGTYSGGDVLEIPLNPLRTQKIRLFLIATDGSILESKDIEITKEYIEEQNVDLDSVEFLNVTESEKQKIQQLKTLLSSLPQAQKLVAMNYIQRMQENWSDDTEKTRVIIEFETYLFDQDVENVDTIIEVLESLLVEWQEDTSEKNVAFNALKNLIPTTITCPVEDEGVTCYDMLMSQLETIHESNDVETNKVLGSSILKSIQDTDTMTNTQKLDFKAILSSLVYGGLGNIPESEVEDVVNDPNQETSSGGIMGILVTISYILWMFLCIFLWIMLLFFIWYKISNTDDSVGFQEFITLKTSLKKTEEITTEQNDTRDMADILWADTTNVDKTSSQESDPLSTNDDDTSSDVLQETSVEADTADASSKEDVSEVPDWLAGNFSPEASEEKTNEEISEIPDPLAPPKDDNQGVSKDTSTDTSFEDAEVPDWLQQDLQDENTSEEDEKEKQKDTVSVSDTMETPTELQTEEQIPTQDTESTEVPDWLQQDVESDNEDVSSVSKEDSPKEETTDIPDWLSWDLDAEENTIKTENSSNDTQQNDTKDDTVDTSLEETTDIPDWLQADVQDTSSEEKEQIDDSSSSQDEDIPDWLSGSFDDIDSSNSDTPQETASLDEPFDIEETQETPEEKSIPKENTSEKKVSTPRKKKAETSKKKSTSSKKKTSTTAKAKNTTATKKASTSAKVTADKSTKNTDSKVEGSSKKEADKKPTSKKKDESELWDDGMKVPDWLKSGDE